MTTIFKNTLFIFSFAVCSTMYVIAQADTAELVFDKPYEFISLGEGCKVAGYIRGASLTRYAYPFDWTLSTDFESIYQIIANDFHDYMNINHLKDLKFFDRKMNLFPDEPKNLADRWVLETVYTIESRHDFTVQKDIADVYPDVLEKINRRIERFYQVMQRNDITIFLVRMMISREQAIRFRDLIESKFPHAKFVFVALSNTEDFKHNWHERRIRNFYFNDPVYQWDATINNYRYNNGSYGGLWESIVKQLLMMV